MKKPTVTIENPCHKTWNNLDTIENSKDRYCGECAMNIKDFTNMESEEIIAFLSKYKTEKICCAIRTSPPKSTIQKKINYWDNLIHNNFKDGGYIKSMLLSIFGFLLLSTSCTKNEEDVAPQITLGLPVSPCHYEYLPDTTTQVLNDSIYIEICD